TNDTNMSIKDLKATSRHVVITSMREALAGRSVSKVVLMPAKRRPRVRYAKHSIVWDMVINCTTAPGCQMSSVGRIEDNDNNASISIREHVMLSGTENTTS